jgi:hypothetical protein
MTSSPQSDPFIALWQTAPKPDTHHLANDVQRLNRLHQRLNRSILAILCGIAVLLAFEEATGRLASRGILSVAWTLAVVIVVARHRRARCNRFEALTLDTVSLLNSMIARAKSDLSLARRLYIGTPCGAVLGGLVMKLISAGSPPSAPSPHSGLQLIQTGAGIVTLIVMIVTGLILARSRNLQVKELSEKLKLIEADLQPNM